jgi:hypothetical protein
LSEDKIHSIVEESSGKKWPMTAPCTRSNSGLTSGHAYALLDGITLGDTKLVKVMNPHGHDSYTGPWNDKDSRWTPEFMKQVNLDPTDNGIFYMPLDIFKASFEAFNVNMYDDNWKIDSFIIQPGTVGQSI